GHELVEERGTDRLRREVGDDLFLSALQFRLQFGALAGAQPLPRKLAAKSFDGGPAALDPSERSDHRRDLILPKLPALGQQNEICRRHFPGFNAIGQARQRLNGRRDGHHRREEVALRVFDALADSLLLSLLQQLALANMLQIDTNEIDVLVGKWTP